MTKNRKTYSIHLKCSCYLLFVLFQLSVNAQQDTFFLAKRKGLLGRIGRSIVTDDNFSQPVKTVNPFLRFAGKKINSIQVIGLGFEFNLNDSVKNSRNFFLKAANTLHVNTQADFIKSNLFFKEGDYLIPLLLADNERYLRDQPFLQDALIVVQKNFDDDKIVDVLVFTSDVFSLGGKLKVSSKERIEAEIREENFLGEGWRISLNTLYEKRRDPKVGYGMQLLKRNVFGRFLNASAGFTNFSPAILTGLNNEQSAFFLFEKPLVHRFKRWTGSFELRTNRTANNYLPDSLYKSDFKYGKIATDLWAGFNLGTRNMLIKSLKSFTHFVAARTLYEHFDQVPERYKDTFNYNFANVNGVLFSYNIFRQNSYRTNFIYGFGRNEDLPEGFTGSFTTGWTNKNGKQRTYFGISGDGNYLSSKGRYYTYFFKAGAFAAKQGLQDIDVMIGADHFTELKRLNRNWRNRYFFSFNLAKQFRHFLNPPLLLESQYGLSYFKNGNIEAQSRATLKGESVFFHMKKYLGFRFAPFGFADVSLLTPHGKSFSKSSAYSAIGGGVRMRNESLIFGTVELRGSYFPRVIDDMKNWRIDITTNLRFKFNSVFFKKPDFVNLN